MIHAKFQYHRSSGSGKKFLKVFYQLWAGGHLGHVTWSINTNFRSSFQRRIHMKFGFDWPITVNAEDV